MKKKPKTQK